MLGVWASGQMPSNRRRSASAAVGLALVLMHLAVANGLSYLCLFPQSIRPGSDFDLSLTLCRHGRTTVNIAIIADSSGAILLSKTVTLEVSPLTGKLNTVIKLPIPDTLSEVSYKVNIAGNGAVKFFNSSTVTVLQKSVSILIQTDKALYKPGQTVMFRAVVIYPTMKPYKDGMDIVIYDKDGNRIAQWLQKKSDQGVFSGKLDLSPLTSLGDWTITVKTKVDTASKNFEVAEYVLPKFEVSVILPPYFLLNVEQPQLQPALQITITARYTYGQPVKGTAKLTAQVLTWNTEKQFTWMKTVNLVDGTASCEITTEQLSYLVPDWLKKGLSDGTVPAWTLLVWQQIIVAAAVTETVTGVTLSDNSTVTCYKEKYDLSFMDITPDSYKPTLLYTGFMQLKQKDGSAPILSDIKRRNGQFKEITVTVTTEQFSWFPWSFVRRDICPKIFSLTKNFPLTPSGLVPFDFEINSNCSVTIKALFLDISTNSNLTAEKRISAFESKSSRFVQVTLENGGSSIKPGDVVQLKVRKPASEQTVYYMFMSKGEIVISEMISNIKEASYTIRLNVNRELAQKLAPTARCVVWIVVDNSEIIADSIDFNVNGAFANNVSLKFSQDKVKPGDNVSLTVHGTPNSTAYLCGVDQSVLLLKGGNDITQNMVLDDLKKYEGVTNRGFKWRPFFDFFWPVPSGGKNSIEVLENAHLGYMTDGLLFTKEFTDGENTFIRKDGVEVLAFSGVGPDLSGSPSPSSPPIAVRQRFPETWIFDSLSIGTDGYGTAKFGVPDTITSWVTTAFAVSDKDGLGIAPLASKLTVFQSFFVSMNLPYCINRGEEFALKVTIFNYLATTLSVQVLLKASPFFNVRLEKNIIKSTNVTKDVMLPINDAVTVQFWITPTKLGLIPIECWAFGGLAGDAERRMLLVVPEGIPQQYSTSMLIDLTKGKNGFTTTLDVKLPAKYLVPESPRLQITLCGDILGTTLNGLDKLIQMPYGCGEQTMLALAPNVYILEYLNSTGTLTPDIETKCKGYTLSGYQRELTFQRNDGSFSAFGNSDPSGSVWLSSYVILVFCQAKSIIPVEDYKIAFTMTWIMEQQNDNGSFTEPPNGRVIHTDMQGGSSKGITLTAYVFIALLENRDNTVINKTLLNDSLSKARVYLEKQLNSITDSYSLCIISYALVLANSSKADLALSKRDALAIVDSNGLKHWEKIEKVAAQSGSFIPPYKQSSALNIEMTAYALMTCTLRKDSSGAVPIVKWVIAQRNPDGGFVSTQDTVMAIQALARFAALIYGSVRSFNLNVNALIGLEKHDFDPITRENMQSLQIWEPRTTTGTVHCTAKGSGTAIIQLNVLYNVYKVEESYGFSFTIETTRKDNDTVVVKTCSRWTKKDRKCGMALETVQLLSGYDYVNVTEVGKIRGLIKEIDPVPGFVNIYYDTLDDVAICISIIMIRTTEVNNMKNATIKVVEYYNPGNFFIGTYGLSKDLPVA